MMTLEAMSVETLVSGGFNSAEQVMGEWPTPGPLGWGVGDGLVSHPREKNIIIETRHFFQDSRLTEKCKGLFSDGAPRAEVGKVSVLQVKSYSILN